MNFLFLTLFFSSSLVWSKTLRPFSDPSARDRNSDTLRLVFDLQCLEEQQTTFEDVFETILDDYPCLHRHHKYSEKIFETTNYVFAYLDFAGNDVALHRCIDEELDQPCLFESEYEKVYKLNIDYSTDSCSSVNIESALWGLDYWNDGIIDDDNQYHYPSFDNPAVDIYILDTGVLITHEQFKNTDGSSRVTWLDPSNSTILNSHGTHVAGSAAGNTVGVSGTNFPIYSYSVCGLDPADTRQCYDSDINAGFEAVITRMESQPTRKGVINMSWGGYNATHPHVDLILDAYFEQVANAGGILVAAAGNDDSYTEWASPANSDYTIAVGSLYGTGKSYFSNYGPMTDIWAPGSSIYSSISTCDACYGSKSGTSMSSPHITGEVANLLARNSTLDREGILAILRDPTRSRSLTFSLNSPCTTGPEWCVAAYGFCQLPVTVPPVTVPPVTVTTAVPCDGECVSSHRKKTCVATNKVDCLLIGGYCGWIPDPNCGGTVPTDPPNPTATDPPVSSECCVGGHSSCSKLTPIDCSNAPSKKNCFLGACP